MIAPAAVDKQHAGREALLAEAMSPDQSQRGLVARLDAGLHPVQAQLLEGVPQHQPQAFRHVALAGGGSEGRVAQGGRLESSPDDIVDGEQAGHRAAAAHADHQPLAAGLGKACQVSPELLHRRGHGVPRMMQAHAGPSQHEEFVLIVSTKRTQRHPRGPLRQTSRPRSLMFPHDPQLSPTPRPPRTSHTPPRISCAPPRPCISRAPHRSVPQRPALPSAPPSPLAASFIPMNVAPYCLLRVGCHNHMLIGG
jgi:hypothetical protein